MKVVNLETLLRLDTKIIQFGVSSKELEPLEIFCCCCKFLYAPLTFILILIHETQKYICLVKNAIDFMDHDLIG